MSGEYRFDPSHLGVNTSELRENEIEGDAKKEKTQAERLESLKEANTLAIDVPFIDLQKMKAELETTLGLSLKDRGEAHITLIRPPDAKILRDGLLSEDDLTAFDDCIGQDVEITGIGTIPPGLDTAGIKTLLDEEAQLVATDSKFKPKGVTFFAIVRLPENIQTKLDSLIDQVNANEPNPKKHRPKINPHVTIGFTLQDRFDGSKSIINTNFETAVKGIPYEEVVAQKPVRDAEGNQIKDAKGNPVSKYEAI